MGDVAALFWRQSISLSDAIHVPYIKLATTAAHKFKQPPRHSQLEFCLKFSSARNMASLSETRVLESLFQSALNEYEKHTGINLVRHPLAAQLEHCDDVESMTEVLQGQARAFLEFRRGNKRVLTLLKRTAEAFYKLSGTASLAESIGLVC
jgi:hypothetical protein